jgi:hypothetical protein
LTVILVFFPASPKLYWVVPPLQTCSTYKFIYDDLCFVYMFIFWVYLPHMRENMQPLSFWAWLTSININLACVNSVCTDICIPSHRSKEKVLRPEFKRPSLLFLQLASCGTKNKSLLFSGLVLHYLCGRNTSNNCNNGGDWDLMLLSDLIEVFWTESNQRVHSPVFAPCIRCFGFADGYFMNTWGYQT